MATMGLDTIDIPTYSYITYAESYGYNTCRLSSRIPYSGPQ